jgi:hypothetical protein
MEIKLILVSVSFFASHIKGFARAFPYRLFVAFYINNSCEETNSFSSHIQTWGFNIKFIIIIIIIFFFFIAAVVVVASSCKNGLKLWNPNMAENLISTWESF